MEAGLLWFEELCSTFTVDPQAATAALLLFRNSDGACGHCMHFITASSRGDVKFQALLALKYAMVKNWNSFTPDAQTGFHVFLWGLILDERPREPYVLNTLIQLYALFVKKCWMSDSADKRSLYFHSIAALHSDGGSDSISRLYVAAKVLRGVIECMFDVDALDTGFSHADNVFIRRDFIRCVGASSPLGLTQAVAVSMSMLANMHQLTAPFDLSVHGAQHSPVVSMLDTRLIDLVLSVGEISEVLSSILRVCESHATSMISEMESSAVDGGIVACGPNMGTPGMAWLAPLLDRSVADVLFQLHHRMRSVLIALNFSRASLHITLTSQTASQKLSESLRGCLSSVGSVVLALASVDLASVFTSPEQRILFGEALLSGGIVCLEANTSAILSAEGTGDFFSLLFHMSDDGEYALQEFARGADLLVRLLGNFKLSLICSMPSFENFVSKVVFLTNLVSKYLKLFTDSSSPPRDSNLIHLCSRYHHLISTSDSLLGGPLVDILQNCLDIWSAIFGDPLLSALSSSLSEKDALVASRLRAGLKLECKEIFEHSFLCTLSVVIMDTLKSDDEEIDVENDEIFERSVFNLIKGISEIGRLSISSALSMVCTTVRQSISGFEDLIVLLASPNNVTEKDLQCEITKQLEVQRLCAIFLSCLLLESDCTWLHVNDSRTVSSEIPLIPTALFEHSGMNRLLGINIENDFQTEIMEAVSIMLQNLRQQLGFHQIFADSGITTVSFSQCQKLFIGAATSALVVQGSLRFLRDFIWAYVDPTADMYEVSPHLVFPKLMDAMEADNFTESFFGPVLQMSFYTMVKLSKGDDNLAYVALGVLNSVSKLNRLPVLGNCLGLQQFYRYARDSICSTAKTENDYTLLPDQSLSVINQALLWQYLGYVGHEFAANQDVKMVAIGNRYLSEMCRNLRESMEYSSYLLIEEMRLSGETISEGARNLLHLVSSCRGFARCTVSLCPDVIAFLDAALPLLYDAVAGVVASSDGHSFIASKLLVEWIGLLSDFTETTPISTLSNSTLSVMMSLTKETLLQLVFNHLKQLSSDLKGIKSPCRSGIEASDTLFVEILCTSLVFLDNVASSDVSVSIRRVGCRSARLKSESAQYSTDDVDGVLCVAMIMISDLMMIDILMSFKVVQDKYFSIMNLILRSHPIMLCKHMISILGGNEIEAERIIIVLRKMLSHVLSCVDTGDSSSGRLALLTLKSMCAFYKKISATDPVIFTGDKNIVSKVIQQATDHFLRESLAYLLCMMIPGSVAPERSHNFQEILFTSSALLRLKDRTDAFASTLLEIVGMDSGHRLHAFMAQFLDTDTVLSPERRRTNDNIIGCFNKLFSARGVNLQEITRLNERNFISNMRECVVELQLICGQGTA